MKNKLTLLIVTVLFILLLAFLAADQMNTLAVQPISFRVSVNGEMETVSLWESEDKVSYVFLPSYATAEQVQIHLNTQGPVYCDGKQLYEGMPCDGFLDGETHTIRFGKWGREVSQPLVFAYSKNIATMHVDTQSGSMEYIHEQKGNEEIAAMRLYSSEGMLEYAGDLQSIKGRGNGTWLNAEKKPYGIELAEEAELLGMGQARKWILLANAEDHSHIRNKLVYDFAADMGLKYSPECQWVDLYLNGVYAGLYLLSEKNEVHSERVNLASEGSFLVSKEYHNRLEEQNLPHIETDSFQSFRVHYPQNLSAEALGELKEIWQSVENAIMSEQGFDSVSGKYFWEISDLDSWVESYLIDEVFGNMDGFIASRYFYFDSTTDPKIYAGPVWDYDKSIGNDTDIYWSGVNPNVQILQRYAYDSQNLQLWAQKLYEQNWFRDALKVKFETKILPLVETLLNGKIRAYTDLIRYAAGLDAVRWGYAQTDDIDCAVAKLVKYLDEHVEYLTHVWLEGGKYYQVSFLKNVCDQFDTVPEGGYLQALPDSAEREELTFTGWYYVQTDEPYDISKPITEDVQIYAKWTDNSTNKIQKITLLVPLAVFGVLGMLLVIQELTYQKKRN